MAVNIVIARCEAEDDARRIVRDGNAHDALVAALRATDRRTDPFDDLLCWCAYSRLHEREGHSAVCHEARAALKFAEETR